MRGRWRSFLCKTFHIWTKMYQSAFGLSPWKSKKWCQKKKKHLREKSGAERVVRIFRARRRGRRRWRSSMALSLCANPTQQTLEMTCNELMCCWLPGRERSVGQWCHCVYNKQPALLQILKKQVTADCWQSWWMSSTAALSWVWDDVCVCEDARTFNVFS